MRAAVIATGAELVAGLVKESNSNFIARELSEVGIELVNIFICGDQKESIKQNINYARQAADLIFISGGLGPTKDDITKVAFAEELGIEMTYSAEIEKSLVKFFKKTQSEISENNFSQAYLPAGAEILENRHGTAPALKFTAQGKQFYLLPGVPIELKSIFNKQIKADLVSLTENKFLSQEFNFIGIGESTLAAEIEKLKLDQRLIISYQAGRGEVKLRIKFNSKNNYAAEQIGQQLIKNATEIIKDKFSTYLYSFDDQDIVDIVAKTLQEQGLTIAAAESFTGGTLAERLTAKAGSSGFFKGSVVAYTKELKNKLLKINNKLLDKYGTVSKQCAEKMAANVANILETSIGISATGAAGPDPLEGHPAGTMFVAIYYQGEIRSWKLEKSYGRSLNRFYASQFLFLELKNLLTKIKEEDKLCLKK
ncbi:competence/damage-inducible protein A [Halanaerobium salsuginis]|uniref:Putative competence-damage inducible protein n=1 Tax=Halanaerobium salsuginis TaxID=29563 RepID=A0A1I4F4Y3_9FIRM|nr:competence/damage-inducible protein A [Halanaerobium salsuginis]SFL12984.1 nicotinamide-nucleotide amidase [Halanaerobium salsuginis]